MLVEQLNLFTFDYWRILRTGFKAGGIGFRGLGLGQSPKMANFRKSMFSGKK